MFNLQLGALHQNQSRQCNIYPSLLWHPGNGALNQTPTLHLSLHGNHVTL